MKSCRKLACRSRPRLLWSLLCILIGGGVAGMVLPAAAGPLADAVARARAEAGLPPQPEPPAAGRPPREVPPDRQQAQPKPPAEPAAASRPPAALAISLSLPITGTRDTQVRAAILRQLDRLKAEAGRRGVLVLEFAAGADEAEAASDFGRSLALARFLTDDRLAGVKTVAFLPRGATGHAVLVALACEEIVMAHDAVLGPANTSEPLVDEPMRVAYREIATRRRTVPPAVAVGLLDPATEVVRAVTEAGDQFVERRELPGLRDRVAVIETVDLGPAPLAITGRRLRELGLVRGLASSPAELADVLGLPERSLQIDPTLGRGWKAAVVSLTGPITADTAARVRKRLDGAIQDGANFLCLEIDSPGGTPEQSIVLSRWLASLDPARVRTVAYVTREARGDAALVALACDELVIREGATLGGEGAAAIDERQGQAIAVAWREAVAKPRGKTWSLPVALVVPGFAVQQAVQAATGREEYFSEDELLSRDDRAGWRLSGKLRAGPLIMDAHEAEAIGLATHIVIGFADMLDVYGLTDELTVMRPGWADTLLDALASPGLAWLLLLIGGAGLYIELHTPGFGIGGFIAMVAFIIYFWSQYLHGTSGWLEVLLFVAGLTCLVAEIFLVPGVGVLGLGGGLLVIASLVLASQSFVLPTNDYQIRQMQWSLLGLLAAGGGVAAFGLLTRRWLPATPVLRNVLLPPPEEGAVASDATGDLVDASGVTSSRLAPAGKARIDGRLHDVCSAGMLIEPGTPIRVVAIRGGRIIVAPTDS